MAPISPFFADWLYLNLNEATGLENSVSVHLTDFPKAKKECIDKNLEERMSYAQRISSLVLSLRKKEKLRVRQPLKRILLPVLNESFNEQVELVKDLILAETNIKEIEYITDTTGIIKKKIKPNFKTLGKKLGRHMKEASSIIMLLDQDQIASIEKSDAYQLNVGGELFDLSLEDFEIFSEDIPGWQVATDGPITVALDISLDDDLIAEGTAREIVNRIQNIRKNKDFDVTDRIVVTLSDHERISPAIDKYGDYIKGEVLADNILLNGAEGGDDVDIYDDLSIKIKVSKTG